MPAFRAGIYEFSSRWKDVDGWIKSGHDEYTITPTHPPPKRLTTVESGDKRAAILKFPADLSEAKTASGRTGKVEEGQKEPPSPLMREGRG